MKIFNIVFMLTFSLASFAQAYDGSNYRGFTVCSNSSRDYLVIDHRKGVVSFHDPEIYNKYTILGTDVNPADDERSNQVSIEYYVFNENDGVVFNIVNFRDNSRVGRLETGGKRSKVLKTFASCAWKASL